jgi:hypothetical protein
VTFAKAAGLIILSPAFGMKHRVSQNMQRTI